MEQKVLYIEKTIKRKKTAVRSKQFCFEAMCLIDDMRDSGKGVIGMAADALFYLFAGTDITDSDLKALPPEQLTMLCTKLFLWYREELLCAAGYAGNREQTQNGDFKLRDIYRKAFAAWGTLPSELEKQPPRLLLFALSGEPTENTQQLDSDIDPQAKIFYGL